MRLMLCSTAPWFPSGYGNQVRTFAPRLRDLGHELAITATHGLEGRILPWQGMPVFPRGRLPDALDVVGAHCERFRADALVTLLDVWPLAPAAYGGTPWAPWVPVDTETLSPHVADKLRAATLPIAMSRHGESAMRDAGIECAYVPHGFDPAAFSPMPRKEARELLRWREDSFVVGVVAANTLGTGVPSRKALYEQLSAFAMLRRKHSDARLYLHTNRGDDGLDGAMDLPAACRYLGLAESDVAFADPHGLVLGLPDTYMRAVYSGLDVLSSVTCGEGFGVPIVEAQACGCPVVVGDWTAPAELCGAGWKVSRDDSHELWTSLGACWRLPRPEAIAECLEQAYGARGDESVRARALAFAADYSADAITEKYWRPALAELARRIEPARAAAAE